MNGGDALLAATLFARDPAGFGGIVLRGAGPARDALVARLAAALPEGAPVKRLPRGADADALLGGIDLAAALAGEAKARRPGLIGMAAGGVLVVPMAERLDASVAAVLGQALDGGAGVGLLLLDDGIEGEEVAPGLRERCAFYADVSDVRPESIRAWAGSDAGREEGVFGRYEAGPTIEGVAQIPAIAAAFGVDSARALRFALKMHRMLGETDAALEAAARLALAHRATRVPPETDAAQQEAQHDAGDSGESNANGPLEDRVIEAVRAALPPDVLAAIAARGRGQCGGQAGERRKSPVRGRPLGSRAGLPRNGGRLALVDTLRAAAPWQRLRRAEGDSRVHVRKGDLRIKRHESRAEAVTIFAVDASGSAAAARLGEAKGAVELLLAEAYVKRMQVALIAFRGEGAELLLPPTRSLTRARRALADLPGGGGTPLAAGIDAARELADGVKSKERTPFVVLLTDGRANVASGGGGRAAAASEAERAAQRLAARAIPAVCIDTSARPRPEAEAIARAMAGRYLPLPQGGAPGIGAAIKALQ